MKHRIRSYTIIELIVVMIISAIVIAIAYKTYGIIFLQSLQAKTKNEQIRQMSLLDVLVERDFSNSNYVLTAEDGFSCFYGNKKIDYRWEQHFILRAEGTATDTFQVRPANIDFRFLKEEVTTPNRHVDELSFEFTYKEEIVYYSFRKVYSAEFLMASDFFQIPVE